MNAMTIDVPRAVVFPARHEFALKPVDAAVPLAPYEVRGSTVCSLISPGTELAWAGGDNFPVFPGYAAVFRAQEFGGAVRGIEHGALLLCMGPHRNYQQLDARHTIPVPAGLEPRQAVLARLMGVSMTTLMTTTARPGDRVVISGAGPVGFLAARMFALGGYDVWVIEPNEARRRLAEEAGLRRVLARMPLDDSSFIGTVALVVDCSGHEQSVLDACEVVRQRGEVVLVGVPWKRQTDIYAHALLDLVFRRFVVLRSGWEWELPMHGKQFEWEELMKGYNNSSQSIFSGLRKALVWLAQGRIGAERLIYAVEPRDTARVYVDLLARRGDGLFPVFDWTSGEGQQCSSTSSRTNPK